MESSMSSLLVIENNNTNNNNNNLSQTNSSSSNLIERIEEITEEIVNEMSDSISGEKYSSESPKKRLKTENNSSDNSNQLIKEKLEQRLGGILCCAVCLDLPKSGIFQVWPLILCFYTYFFENKWQTYKSSINNSFSLRKMSKFRHLFDFLCLQLSIILLLFTFIVRIQ